MCTPGCERGQPLCTAANPSPAVAQTGSCPLSPAGSPCCPFPCPLTLLLPPLHGPEERLQLGCVQGGVGGGGMLPEGALDALVGQLVPEHSLQLGRGLQGRAKDRCWGVGAACLDRRRLGWRLQRQDAGGAGTGRLVVWWVGGCVGMGRGVDAALSSLAPRNIVDRLERKFGQEWRPEGCADHEPSGPDR